MAGVYSWVSKLGISASNPVDARYNFDEASIGLTEEILNLNGLNGTRSQKKEMTRVGIRRVAGNIRMSPTAVELAALLPWIYGAAASGTTFALDDTLPARYVTVSKDDGTDGKVFTYDGVKVARATFSATQNAPLSLSLDLVGIDETVGNAASFPALSIEITTKPFIFTDMSGAFSIASTAYNCRDWELTIDNMIDTERFYNSQTLTAAMPTGRKVSLRATLPYGDSEAVYNAGSSGAAVSSTFTNGAVSILFSMAALVWGRMTPPVQRGSEIVQTLMGDAYMSSTTRELVTTLDSTP